MSENINEKPSVVLDGKKYERIPVKTCLVTAETEGICRSAFAKRRYRFHKRKNGCLLSRANNKA